MAKNKDIYDEDLDIEDKKEEKGGNKFKTILMGIIFLIIWLGIFCVLIKLDVGGFGSKVMAPIFKDVPVINKILPSTDDTDSSSYPYKSLADAITYIKELEKNVQDANDQISADNEKIAELNSEVERLKNFEQEKEQFEKIKKQFYDEVVFGDDAIPYDNYKKYYEEINPDYAETLYKQVLEKYMYDENYKELANAYSTMKPKKAAAALYEMTGDLDKVVTILQNMNTENRAAILDALSDIDAVFCGKITVMLAP